MKAAVEALAEVGEVGVAVEPLARRLGVTKGSFYWHFRDRDALWAALVTEFERRGVDEVVAQLAEETDPRERLRRLLARAWGSPVHLRAQRALLGSRRPDVAAMLARVHARRREFLVRCYVDLGLPAERAEAWATTAYATYLGAIQLADTAPFDQPATLARFVEHLAAVMVPPG